MKKLYWFILKSFLPLFAMTFFIVLFIVLMQFLWLYMSDIVGKGLSIGILAELFFYAAVSMVPMALPLAILLASLMTFGNLGERSELTAIKASGIPLIQTMAPLIVLISAISIGAFFFQNDVLPRAQVKMWTLLFSARQKSPELEIPEGTFYDQIPGYNLYVKHKNRETGMLYDVMIYDVKRGGDNATILMADSARLAFTKDMRYLYLHLFTGEQFENLREQRTGDRNIPFRRESFVDKEVLISFDNNFNRLDEGGMRNQYVGKNIVELQQTIDSINTLVDSIGNDRRPGFQHAAFPILISRANGASSAGDIGSLRTSANPDRKKESEEKPAMKVDLDSLLSQLNPQGIETVYTAALNINRNRSQEMEFQSIRVADEKFRIRRHEIELIKKFTLSVACLIFLFIGAPLGAIIRKGGLGMPMVISVFIFIFYYIIDNTGFKMARDGHIVVWVGIWLSTFVLIPLGVLVTYKAMNDSSVFNPDLYLAAIRKIFGLPEKRLVALKKVIINDLDPEVTAGMVLHGASMVEEWLRKHPKPEGYVAYWKKGYSMKRIAEIGAMIDETVEYLGDSPDIKVIDKLNKMPAIRPIAIYSPTRRKALRRIAMWFFPIGLPIYLIAHPYLRRLEKEMREAAKNYLALAGIFSIFANNETATGREAEADSETTVEITETATGREAEAE